MRTVSNVGAAGALCIVLWSGLQEVRDEVRELRGDVVEYRGEVTRLQAEYASLERQCQGGAR